MAQNLLGMIHQRFPKEQILFDLLRVAMGQFSIISNIFIDARLFSLLFSTSFSSYINRLLSTYIYGIMSSSSYINFLFFQYFPLFPLPIFYPLLFYSFVCNAPYYEASSRYNLNGYLTFYRKCLILCFSFPILLLFVMLLKIPLIRNLSLRSITKG